MARNNGATSTLFLNANGGNVSLVQSGSGGVAIGTATVPAGVKLNVQGGDAVFGGAIDIGYEIVVGPSQQVSYAGCPSGKKVLGGGCFANADLESSRPDESGFYGPPPGWICYAGAGNETTAYAICAKVK